MSRISVYSDNQIVSMSNPEDLLIAAETMVEKCKIKATLKRSKKVARKQVKA